ncbi:MAG: LysR substrate-binding domain-containing protein [Pseudomonadota bacterium]
MKRLANLNQLRTFEVAARRLSFKDAADELNVTHAAVSHQVKALEADLGKPLFLRKPRRVELTQTGTILFGKLNRIFNDLADALSGLNEAEMSGSLNLSVAPFFGNRILLPRLERFHRCHPNITICAQMESSMTDFRKSDLDAAIRYGPGGWPDLDAVKLNNDRNVPVCVPALIEGEQVPLAVERIASLPLAKVKNRDKDWIDWFASLGYDPQTPLTFLTYENRARAIDLAFSGHGVALADIDLVRDDLALGNLIQVHPHSLVCQNAMWVVWPKTDYPDPRLALFAEWLRADLQSS